MTLNVMVLRNNQLINSHVYQHGDVVELPEARAKELCKLKQVAITSKSATPLPVAIPRSEQIRAREEAARNPAPETAERSVAKTRK